MSAITETKYVTFICFPWNYKTNLAGKISAWAAFFFFGWVYHPVTALHRCFKKLFVGGKVHSIGKKNLLKDPLSKNLANFDNPRIKGQVNGIYITTNETNLAATNQFFKEHPRPNDEKQTIHIGCATWHNFDIMCERKSSYGLIVDFNPENSKFIEKTIDLINVSESRDIFKQKMNDYLNLLEGDKKDLFFHWDQKGLPTEKIEKELEREGSWLQTEDNYLFIKKLVSRDRVVAITEDITNFENFSRLRKFLDSQNISIDTLYLSNICNFMMSDSRKSSFIKSIKQLLQNDTILINCPKLIARDTEMILCQKSILGKEILSRSYDTRKLFEDNI